MSEQTDPLEANREQMAAQNASTMATDAAHRQVQERLENPEFFQQLRDADVTSDEFDWLEREMGPALSGSHIIGNRSQDYERHVEFGTRAEAERMISEGSPGRLCDGKRLEIAQGAHKRPDKDVKTEYTVDERRALRGAMQAAGALRSLSIENTGLRSVTEATAVSKVEKNEQEAESRRERAAEFFG